MFINCPNCSALVATNLATGLPPERCPQCGFGLLAEGAAPAFAPAPLAPAPAPAPAPGPARPQAGQPVFIPLTPSRPASDRAGGDGTGATPEVPAAAPQAAVPQPEPELQPEPATATATATATAPAPAPEPAPESAADPAPPLVPPATPAPPDPPAGASAEDAAAAAAPARPAPRFLARRTGAGLPATDRRHIALAAGLAMLLVVQLLLADRARLAADAGWRPVVAALCGALRCSLPAWREPSAIAVEQRDVRPVPGREGVLRASATIRNDGRWAQAWPRLLLTLSDVDGRALGMRSFEPAEYLASPPQDVTIARGESAALVMDIVEPSPHAVAFNFDFH